MSPTDISSLAKVLGIEDDIEWHSLAACEGMPYKDKDPFFEEYEENVVVAEAVDNLCLSCPVTKECYFYGRKFKSTGVHGGFYMTNGEVNAIRNSHKTERVIMDLKEEIFDE